VLELGDVKAALADFHRLWRHGSLDERKEMVRLLVEKPETAHYAMTIRVHARGDCVTGPASKGSGG
jgi:hypothetical protein